MTGSSKHLDQPASPSPRRPLEIACDESGYEGEKLIGATNDMFAHAGVRLDVEVATGCMRELRDRIRSPAQEYKANHLQREKHRAVLVWLLGPSAPLLGNSRVFLVDKEYFIVASVIEQLVDVDERDGEMAVTLYREGRRAFDRDRWEAFLLSSNNLLRVRDREQPDAAALVDGFFRALDGLRDDSANGPAGEILDRLQSARPRAEALREHLHRNPTMIPPLDPLIPAIVQAVAYWGKDGEPVSIVHHRQNNLSEERIAELMEMLNGADVDPPGCSPTGRLAGLRLADSRSDARIQLADILAGVARQIASDELNNRGDAQLTALLHPYVDLTSIWGDPRSWSLLSPTPGTQPG